MSTQPTQAQQAEIILLTRVSRPAFIEKLAAESGYTVADAAEAQRMFDLGDVVVPAVSHYLNKVAASGHMAAASVAKEAADAAFAACGISTVQAVPESTAGSYLSDEQIKSAAAALLVERAKAADLMSGCGVPAGSSQAEDEEEEKKKQQAGNPVVA